MNCYQEISLLPHSEINIYFIWEKLYQQIHLSLVKNKVTEGLSIIGVSFPEYNSETYALGTKLRLFSRDRHILEKICWDKELSNLKDYLSISEISLVPEKLEGHACFKHIKPRGSKEKLAKRRAERKGETLEEAWVHFEGYEPKISSLPYINMKSHTNGHRFRLFIERYVTDQSTLGMYSCYGLSNISTVPLF